MHTLTIPRTACLAAVLALASAGAFAQTNPPAGGARADVQAPAAAPVDIRDAWARPTVPGQSGGGAFMKLQARSGLRLVSVSTPVAAEAAVHEMKMEGDVMHMRELTGGLELPPHQTVELKPGGYHIMFTGLKQPLRKGTSFPLTLHFVDAKGAKSTAEVQVPVSMMPPAAGGMGHMRMQ